MGSIRSRGTRAEIFEYSGCMATKHVAVRLDDETIAQVDALIPAFSTPWRPARRSDVLRALIRAGLHARMGNVPGAFSAGRGAPKSGKFSGRRSGG
jgi:hypothetical protein